MTSLQQQLQNSRSFWLVISILLLFQFCLGLYSAQKLSVTHDEYWHLPVGLLTWKTGRTDYDRLNPPLIRNWATLPLLFTSAQTGDPEHSSDPADYGDAFLKANPEQYHHYYVLGRVMILILAVTSGLLLAVCARELFGPSAACLAVFLWSMSPNILANAALGTQDLAIAGCFLATLYCGWKFALAGSWRWALITGAVLGLAQITKYTAILLVPLLIMQWILLRVKNPEIKTETPAKVILGRWVALLLVCCLIMNAGYLFQGSFQSASTYQFQSSELKILNQLPALLQSIPLPLPRDYLLGFDLQRHIMQQSHPTFLDLEWRLTGFRSYYIFTLLYKLPHGIQLILLLAAWQWFQQRRTTLMSPRVLGMLLSPVVLLIGIASLSNNQLGLRYILPVIPFLFLLIAPLGELIDLEKRKALALALIVACVSLPFSLRYAPDHLAYFNEFSGGPENGSYHLIDSNIDWGQDFYRLKAYLEQHPTDDLGLAYFGTIPPSMLGTPYRIPPELQPQPGTYAISASLLQGRPYSVRKEDGSRHNLGTDALGYFRFFEPKRRLGYSINVYELTPEDVYRWQNAVNQARMGLMPSN